MAPMTTILKTWKMKREKDMDDISNVNDKKDTNGISEMEVGTVKRYSRGFATFFVSFAHGLPDVQAMIRQYLFIRA